MSYWDFFIRKKSKICILRIKDERNTADISFGYPIYSYSVTQSYANSCRGDVVSDTFNNVSRDEDNILDQMYKEQICPDVSYDDFWFSLHYTKMHTIIELSLKPNFMGSFF